MNELPETQCGYVCRRSGGASLRRPPLFHELHSPPGALSGSHSREEEKTHVFNRGRGKVAILKYAHCIFFFFKRGREGERGRNINVQLPLVHSQLGTWPTTQAGALDWESNQPPFGSQASTQST